MERCAQILSVGTLRRSDTAVRRLPKVFLAGRRIQLTVTHHAAVANTCQFQFPGFREPLSSSDSGSVIIVTTLNIVRGTENDKHYL